MNVTLIILLTLFSMAVTAQETCPPGQLVQSLLDRRADLAKMANIYLQSRTGIGMQQFARLRDEIFALDNEIPTEFLRQGLEIFRMTGNPSCAIGAYNKISGMNFNVQPYTDATWDLLLDGEVVKQRLTEDELVRVLSQTL